MYHKSELSNRATLITIPDEHTSATTVLVMFPVGSRYETKELNGISHFIEHMMFKGTEKRPTTLDISRELDGYGAEYNAYTSKDYTGYYVRIDAQKAETAMDIVADMLWNSKFDAEEIEREKGVIAEELHMYEDNPIMHIDECLEESMFFGSPLGWKIGGEDAIIAKFTREQMVRFRDMFYTPNNMTVVIAGKLPANIEQKAEQYFGNAQRESQETDFIRHEFVDSPIVSLKWKETEQAVMALGFRGLKYLDDDIYALKLLHVIVGGTMSSRMFIEVRERRGLAYIVRTDVSPYHETGLFSVHAGLLPTKVEEALNTILDELKKVKEHGVTQLELTQAKEHMRGKITLSLENSSALAEFYAKQWSVTGIMETPEERFAKLNAVTHDDIVRVARKVIDMSHMKLAMIGPFKDEKPYQDILARYV